ncbi:STAS domain-containing protein [Streptomyces sp. NPDC059009]|uniref:STAS domain-containing protein n=1 Tax=Streptomyces sp. NPDC059009 TaxID=3346694 RepID=UPI0036CD892B
MSRTSLAPHAQLADVKGWPSVTSGLPFSVDAVDVLDTVLVQVVSELDVDTAPELSCVLRLVEQRHCELGLSQVTFADSTALNLLTRHYRHAAAKGGTLSLVDVSLPIRHLLDITGTAALFFPNPGQPNDPHP